MQRFRPDMRVAAQHLPILMAGNSRDLFDGEACFACAVNVAQASTPLGGEERDPLIISGLVAWVFPVADQEHAPIKVETRKVSSSRIAVATANCTIIVIGRVRCSIRSLPRSRFKAARVAALLRRGGLLTFHISIV